MLALILGALLMFGRIAESIPENDAMAALDRAVPALLRDRVTPRGTEVFVAISAAGESLTLAVIGIAVGGVLLARRRRTLLIGWVVALAGAGYLDWGLKLTFRRPRPDGAWQRLYGRSWSFPSGHTMGSLVTYGMLAYLLFGVVHAPLKRATIVAGATLLVLAIALSRLYLGVHYLSDVLGGLAAGTVWLTACISVLETMRRRSDASLRTNGK